MTGPARIATAVDAAEVGRTLAAGFADDPVLTWVFQEPGRAAKLASFFDFLACEALVPLGATWLLPGSCAAWTPPDPPPWPTERADRFGAVLREVCAADDLARLGTLDAAMQEHHPSEPQWYLGVIATVPGSQGAGTGPGAPRAEPGGRRSGPVAFLPRVDQRSERHPVPAARLHDHRRHRTPERTHPHEDVA